MVEAAVTCLIEMTVRSQTNPKSKIVHGQDRS